MSNTQKKFYLTTPIYYVNARPHIGHAYTTIAADVIARRHRLLGDDTFFLTGTDEHGQKIERSAAAAAIPPQQFADQVSAEFRNLWKRMGITNDAYIRTTDEAHKRGVQKLFSLLQKNGFIELRTYTGQYSVGEEMFVDGPPGTIGPDGKPTETVSEENYFFKLSEFQSQLIDLIESDTIAIQPDSRKNEVLSFLRGNIAEAEETKKSKLGNPYAPGALKDLSISRSSFKWGIPVPGDEKHVIYVWLDALANYMTAIGYGSEDPAEQAKFDHYWPADLHLVGKEIIRFHCVYWPAFLMAMKPADTTQEEWNRRMLPKQITAHGWLLFEESKMSKSRGNIVRTETILDAFGTLLPKPAEVSGISGGSAGLQPGESAFEAEGAIAPGFSSSADAAWKHEQDLFAADVLRYFLLREIPFGQDGSFSFDALVTRYNADLANGYGNLVRRTLSMIQHYCSSEVPSHPDWGMQGIVLFQIRSGRRIYGAPLVVANLELARLATVMINFECEATLSLRFSLAVDVTRLLQDLRESTEIEFDDRGALDYIALLIAQTDQLISAGQPWKLAKSADNEDRVKLGDLLYQAAEAIRIITALLHPFMPYATAKVWQQLGLGDIEEAARKGELKDLQWGGLKPGTKLGPLAPIFPRADKGLIQIMTDMETANAPTTKSVASPKSVVENAGLPHVNADLDAAAPTHTEFRESPISSASATPSLNPIAESTHPIAAHHAEPAAPATPDTPLIAIDDFVKIDLRVARIVVAERIPKADKLLRLEVDLGYETRQILSGIAQWYTPEELIGRKIVVIANLAPRKMRGLESHGMLLAASHGEDGKPVLATFGEEIALGSRLK